MRYYWDRADNERVCREGSVMMERKGLPSRPPCHTLLFSYGLAASSETNVVQISRRDSVPQECFKQCLIHVSNQHKKSKDHRSIGGGYTSSPVVDSPF